MPDQPRPGDHERGRWRVTEPNDRAVTRGVSAMRPLSDPGALRRGAPFAGVAFVAALLELAAPNSPSNVPTLAASGALIAVLVAAALSVPWVRLPAWCEALVPLGYFGVVALLHDARGGAASGYPPLVMLPVVWMALYGTRTQLRLAIAGMAITLIAPLMLVGPPLYPGSEWGVSVLSVAVGLLAGPAIQRLVDQSRRRATDVAVLGAITRALTAGSDPRSELCSAAQLVTGAAFAVIFEQGVDGTLVATAGTEGLGLEQLRTDPRTEVSATGEAWRTGRRIYLANATADSRASARLTELTKAGAVLFQPVTRDGRRTAVLVVGFSESRLRMPEPALDMVELVAAEIAAALDRAALVELLAMQARTDPLTGAANRRSWDEELDRELARAQRTGEPLTVALIDMDHFKAYNDSQGHTAGDELLRELVTAIRAELRTGDVIARWGGEEFAVALPACDLDQARAIASRLLDVVPGTQTASIGLTQAMADDTPRTLVGRADRALYAAKDRGRNQVSVLPTPHRSAHATPDRDATVDGVNLGAASPVRP
jgi:diguanylate cyclase (GGDEF)-like protein